MTAIKELGLKMSFLKWAKENWGLILLMSLATFISILFVYSFYHASPDIKAGLIGFLTAVFATLYSHHLTKKREISARHFIEKRTAYLKFINLLFDILKDTQNNKSTSQAKMLKIMTEFTKDLIIWGDYEIIETWNEYSMSAEGNAGNMDATAGMIEKLLRAIRNDLGHDDSALGEHQLWALMLDNKGKKQVLGETQ